MTFMARSNRAIIFISQNMRKILIFQFRKKQNTLAEEASFFYRAFKDHSVSPIFRNAFLDDIDWSGSSLLEDIDGVILGGSGEFDFDGGRAMDDESRLGSYAIAANMVPFIKRLEEKEIPTLAICFGHQIIAHTKGVLVSNDALQAKVGTHQICLTAEGKTDPLFANVPDCFFVQYGHKDSLSALPQGAIVLATGAQCRYSALRFGKCRYSVQFHPELTADDVLLKFQSHPDYLPFNTRPDQLVQESPFGSKVIENYISLL